MRGLRIPRRIMTLRRVMLSPLTPTPLPPEYRGERGKTSQPGTGGGHFGLGTFQHRERGFNVGKLFQRREVIDAIAKEARPC